MVLEGKREGKMSGGGGGAKQRRYWNKYPSQRLQFDPGMGNATSVAASRTQMSSFPRRGAGELKCLVSLRIVCRARRVS